MRGQLFWLGYALFSGRVCRLFGLIKYANIQHPKLSFVFGLQPFLRSSNPLPPPRQQRGMTTELRVKMGALDTYPHTQWLCWHTSALLPGHIHTYIRIIKLYIQNSTKFSTLVTPFIQASSTNGKIMLWPPLKSSNSFIIIIIMLCS